MLNSIATKSPKLVFTIAVVRAAPVSFACTHLLGENSGPQSAPAPLSMVPGDPLAFPVKRLCSGWRLIVPPLWGLQCQMAIGKGWRLGGVALDLHQPLESQGPWPSLPRTPGPVGGTWSVPLVFTFWREVGQVYKMR